MCGAWICARARACVCADLHVRARLRVRVRHACVEYGPVGGCVRAFA